MKRPSACARLLLYVVALFASFARAAETDTLRVDLNALIDSAAHSSSRFAVNVPHPVSTETHGQWSRGNGRSTWVYRAAIPTAVSMSFHASDISLPPSAILTVSVGATVTEYVAHDVSRGELWARPLPGDTLTLSLSVSAAEESRVRIRIDSLQAGYRGLGGGVPDHPHYRLKMATRADTSNSCTENYSCNATDANQGPARATVALIIANEYQCTGTLLNNARGDGTPYVLTARHCQTGELGGGDPNVAASVSVYWDAVSACGSTLGSLYSAGATTQSGAVTVVEQQDAWLIKLNDFPVAADAYYAGWDATGAAFAGGYSVHHALGYNKQYVAWNGQSLLEHLSASTLKLGYDSTFWGLVNGLGNVGAGASGGAVFDPNNNVVGNASLAALVSGENSAGVCPKNPPAVPSDSTVTALYTSLAAIWTSTADATSSTGGTTLQSVLDPDNSGHMVIGGLEPLPISISVDHAFANTGDNIVLTWNAAGAQSCMATGNGSGDGWTGSKPATGSLTLTEFAGGQVHYALSCRIGNRIAYGTATVNWNFIPPVVTFIGPTYPVMLGGSYGLNWIANVGPCIATGGASGDGWAGTKATIDSQTIAGNQIGLFTYTLTCGSGPRSVSKSVLFNVVAPSITLTADATQLRAGQHVTLSWFGDGTGGQCSASGGSSNDNWSLYNSNVVSNGNTMVSESVAGTYTYTLTCTGGGLTASSSTTVTFTNDPPFVSLTALAAQQQVYPNNGTPYEVTPDLLWTSNVRGCFVNAVGPNGPLSTAMYVDGLYPAGSISDAQFTPGNYTYTITCGSASASATITWVATPVPNALTVSTHKWAANVAYPLTWSTSTGPCVATGGGAGDGWAGSKTLAGSQMVTETHPGTYTFTLTCGSGGTATQSQQTVYVPPPFIQIYAAPGGGPDATTTLSWTSTVGPCTYVDGSSSAHPTGVQVPPSGSALTTPTSSGNYIYSITCGSGPTALFAATTADVHVPPATTIAASATNVSVNAPVTLTWSSSGSYICYALGGTGVDPWRGTLSGASGSLIVTSRSAGLIIYEVSCGDKNAQVSVTYNDIQASDAPVPAPSVSLSTNAATQVTGQSITLTWTSANVSSCTAGGGSAGDGWSGSVSPSGSMAVTEKSAASVTYSITCTGAPPAASAQTQVTFSAASSGGSTAGSGSTGSGDSGGGGGGGGGALSTFWLLVLSIPLVVRIVEKQRRMTRDISRGNSSCQKKTDYSAWTLPSPGEISWVQRSSAQAQSCWAHPLQRMRKASRRTGTATPESATTRDPTATSLRSSMRHTVFAMASTKRT